MVLKDFFPSFPPWRPRPAAASHGLRPSFAAALHDGLAVLGNAPYPDRSRDVHVRAQNRLDASRRPLPRLDFHPSKTSSWQLMHADATRRPQN